MAPAVDPGGLGSEHAAGLFEGCESYDGQALKFREKGFIDRREIEAGFPLHAGLQFVGEVIKQLRTSVNGHEVVADIRLCNLDPGNWHRLLCVG